MSKEYDSRTVGSRIKKMRKQKNCAQKDLAEALGVTNSHMSNIETGKKNLTLELLVKMCAYFCVSADYFVAGILPSDKVSTRIENMLEQCNEEQLKEIEKYIKIVLSSSYFDL